MTEWTLDLMRPAEPEALAPVEAIQLEQPPYADLVDDAVIDDLELDLADWFS